jgi:hypothetical protein
MHDAIAIALIFGSIFRAGLRITAPPGMLGMGGIRRERAHVICSLTVPRPLI